MKTTPYVKGCTLALELLALEGPNQVTLAASVTQGKRNRPRKMDGTVFFNGGSCFWLDPGVDAPSPSWPN